MVGLFSSCLNISDALVSGDYGKLGRGGSDGCKVPMKVDSLAGLGKMDSYIIPPEWAGLSLTPSDSLSSSKRW